ncbi:MAG: D-alanyl-D-alanine carboxypeptidase, partial [Bacteroides sp.]|nr:D-alanyl-D-alanine carboxypeptidase [Bacteroides sp.]
AKNIKSIIKNAEIENSIETSADEIFSDELDEDFSYDDSNSDAIGDNVVDGTKRDSKRKKMPKRDGDRPIETAFAVQKSSSGVVIEQSSRRVLLNEGMNERCYPASTTKVLTALVVLNNLPLDKIVSVPKKAEGVEGSSIYLRAGQKISVEDLLFGLMLRSGNDAATALAIETSGSVEKFAELMNKTAKELGAVNSNFVNPHGLHDDEHYTTAYDLALITAAAYEKSDFVRIASSQKAKITIDGEARYIGNKNKMLNLYEGANGVKTGYTKRSGRCLVSGALRNNMQLISVVLNYNDMWNDSIRMLNYGFDNYEMTSYEQSLINCKDGANRIEVTVPTSDFDFSQFRYPLRRDKSEYLALKAA